MPKMDVLLKHTYFRRECMCFTGWTPSRAIEHDKVWYFIITDANIDHETYISACYKGSIRVIQLYAKRGGNIHTHEELGLRISSFNGYTNLVELFLSYDADVFIESEKYKCSYNYACIEDYPNPAISLCFIRNSTDIFMKMVEKVGTPAIINYNNTTYPLLYDAISHGCVDIAEYLLENGATIADRYSENNLGWSVLTSYEWFTEHERSFEKSKALFHFVIKHNMIKIEHNKFTDITSYIDKDDYFELIKEIVDNYYIPYMLEREEKELKDYQIYCQILSHISKYLYEHSKYHFTINQYVIDKLPKGIQYVIDRIMEIKPNNKYVEKYLHLYLHRHT